MLYGRLLGEVSSIAASGEVTIGSIEIKDVDVVGMSCQVDYGSGTLPVRLKLYHSPDSSTDYKDTIEYTGFDVDYTASTTQKETEPLDLIDGHYFVTVKNTDGSVAATNVKVWLFIRQKGSVFQDAIKQAVLEELRYKKEGKLEKEPVESAKSGSKT